MPGIFLIQKHLKRFTHQMETLKWNVRQETVILTGHEFERIPSEIPVDKREREKGEKKEFFFKTIYGDQTGK